MKNFSLTYSGIFLFAISKAFEAAGVPFIEGDFETTVLFIGQAVGVVAALYGRFRAGGIKFWGKRK